jgi:hypothetical protein
MVNKRTLATLEATLSQSKAHLDTVYSTFSLFCFLQYPVSQHGAPSETVPGTGTESMNLILNAAACRTVLLSPPHVGDAFARYKR